MTRRRLFIAAALTTLASLPAAAQNPQPNVDTTTKIAAAERLAEDARRAATPKGQLVNIRVDVVITDQRGSDAPGKRTLSVVASDGYVGRVRSHSNVSGVGNMQLDVDATPALLANGKIRLGLNLQYDGPGPTMGPTGEDRNPVGLPARGTVVSTTINQQMSLIVDNGKSIVAAQSADPIGDRHVSVEVTATILK